MTELSNCPHFSFPSKQFSNLGKIFANRFTIPFLKKKERKRERDRKLWVQQAAKFHRARHKMRSQYGSDEWNCCENKKRKLSQPSVKLHVWASSAWNFSISNELFSDDNEAEESRMRWIPAPSEVCITVIETSSALKCCRCFVLQPTTIIVQLPIQQQNKVISQVSRKRNWSLKFASFSSFKTKHACGY